MQGGMYPLYQVLQPYPLHTEFITHLMDTYDEILVIEETTGVIELQLADRYSVKGKLTNFVPMVVELLPEIIQNIVSEFADVHTEKIDLLTEPGIRPTLCAGCPHRASFFAIKKAAPKGIYTSDIGCYTLGALPPYNAIGSAVCMGASVSMAKGGAEAGIYPAVTVIGDSTFAHSGITPLLDAAAVNTDMTVIIMDNATVAMTGGQPTFVSGEKLVRLIEGLGVEKDHIRTILPLPKNLEENVEIMKEELDYHGLSVIIAARECVQQARKKRS